MKEKWIRAFGTMTYGIYILTTAQDERMNGMVASWVTQVSYDPPLIAVAVHNNRLSHKLIEESGRFALHVLGEDQKEMISRFMASDPDTKFSGIDWKAGRLGCPILEHCVAFFECTLNTRIQPGNHTIFIGEVVAVGEIADKQPLATRDFRGQYIGKA